MFKENMYEDFHLNSDFYEEEKRAEFIVSSKRKKIWAVEIQLLNELLKVCHKYDIQVFVFAGTLLGTVRHGGFIPWDDDIDVCLLPEDYKKLQNVAQSEFQEPFFFQNAMSDKKFHIGYSRLRNSNTTGLITYNVSENYNNGIFIDIFVLNGYTDNCFLLKKQLIQLNVVEKMLHAYFIDINEKKSVKKIGMLIFGKILRCVTKYEFLVRTYERIQGRYDATANRVTLITHNRTKGFMERYWCKKDDLKECLYMQFENIQVPVPASYDKILKHFYGNYMIFPPVEQRGKWHYNIIEFDPDIPYKEYIEKRKRMRQ